jgi:staphylococcal nuclease domain-containing protein 1
MRALSLFSSSTTLLPARLPTLATGHHVCRCVHVSRGEAAANFSAARARARPSLTSSPPNTRRRHSRSLPSPFPPLARAPPASRAPLTPISSFLVPLPLPGFAGFGTVKAVLSGDTLVIVGNPAKPGAPAPELQLSLAGLTAPRLSRHPDQKDEPAGYASREFLRRIVIGRAVRFRVDYRNEKAQRAFGSVWAAPPNAVPGEGGAPAAQSMSVGLAVAASGMARLTVSAEAAAKVPADEIEILKAAAAAAEAAGYGLFGPAAAGTPEAPAVRNLVWNLSAEAAGALAAELGKGPVPAVVEQVLGGGAVRVYLPSKQTMATLNLAAVQCPRATPAAAAAAAAPAPAAAAAASRAPAPFTPPTDVPKPKMTGYGAALASTAAAASAPAPASAARPAAAAAAPAAAALPAGVDPIGAEAKAFTESRLLHVSSSEGGGRRPSPPPTPAPLPHPVLTPISLPNLPPCVQRDVTVQIGGVDKYGNLVGRIDSGGGADIAADLLRAGLGKLADWSTSFTTPTHVGTLRAAERAAMAAKAKIWSGYEAPVRAVAAGARTFSGRLLEVVSGDTLVILTNPTRPAGVAADERRVSLASIRAPRMGNARREEKDQPWAWEAKDWLRRTYAGKDVSVTVDYTRVMGGGAADKDGAEANPGQERSFATVLYTTKKGEDVNVAVGLVGEGFAEVVRHRAGEDRASAYDDLLAAEDAAKASKKGVHSGKEAPAHRFADLSVDSGKAKAHFPFLQRAKTLKAIPEFVFSGGRCKVFVPGENVYFVFGIAGVRCPAIARAGGGPGPSAAAASSASRGGGAPQGQQRQARDGEPLGPEALSFLRESILQQEVEIEAEDVDKNGTVLGPMWIGKGGARRNVGADILRKGLGFAVGSVLERGIREADELAAAEAEAKGVKRGVWQFVKEEEEEVDGKGEDGEDGAPRGMSGSRAAASNAGASSDFPSLGSSASAASNAGAAAASAVPAASAAGGGFPCVLADITDGSHFALHAESDRARIDEVSAALDAMLEAHGTRHAGLGGELKKGRVVAVLAEDNGSGAGRRWLRGRVEGKHKPVEGEKPVSATDEDAGLGVWDVSFIDVGTKTTSTVMCVVLGGADDGGPRRAQGRASLLTPLLSPFLTPPLPPLPLLSDLQAHAPPGGPLFHLPGLCAGGHPRSPPRPWPLRRPRPRRGRNALRGSLGPPAPRKVPRPHRRRHGGPRPRRRGDWRQHGRRDGPRGPRAHRADRGAPRPPPRRHHRPGRQRRRRRGRARRRRGGRRRPRVPPEARGGPEGGQGGPRGHVEVRRRGRQRPRGQASRGGTAARGRGRGGGLGRRGQGEVRARRLWRWWSHKWCERG